MKIRREKTDSGETVIFEADIYSSAEGKVIENLGEIPRINIFGKEFTLSFCNTNANPKFASFDSKT